MKRSAVKFSCSLPAAVMDRLDAYADENFMTRSAVLNVAVRQYLTQVEASNSLKDMVALMTRVVDKGQVDEEAVKQLADFEKLISLATMK